MKKLSALLLAIALVGCSSNIGSEVKTASIEHELESGEKILVDVELDGEGLISKISIDETYKDNDGNATTKKEMKEDYGMSETGKVEWYKQIESLEENLIGTDGSFEVDAEGHATDEDILAGCTIGLTDIEKAVEEAVAAAK